VDVVKLLNFGLTWKHIQRKNLLSYVLDTSTFLKIELARVHKERGICDNIRGYGTFIGFDVPEGHSEIVQRYLFRSGIHLLRCGPHTFGLRPSLILGPKHAAYLRDSLMYYSSNIPKN
jgi:4-aminobutyrate aminotransferase-like enzyme